MLWAETLAECECLVGIIYILKGYSSTLQGNKLKHHVAQNQ